jgi:head-tail adaptor
MPRTDRYQAIAAGRRDHPVAIDQAVDSTPPSNFPTQQWTTLVDPYWCDRVDVSGSETIRADQTVAPIKTIWTGPYRSDLDPYSVDVAKVRRLRYQGRTYDIETALVIGVRSSIQFTTAARIG